MSTEVNKIIAFVGGFKDTILIPLAKAGVLDADLCREARGMYAEEIEKKSKPITVIPIEKDGKYGCFHPFTPAELEIGEHKYGSVEHYIVASAYFGSDDEFSSYIRDSKNAEIAHRRGAAADNGGKVRRHDFEVARDVELKVAYKAFLLKNPEHLQLLKETGELPIVYNHNTDKYHGATPDGNGKNMIGHVLMALRKEM